MAHAEYCRHAPANRNDPQDIVQHAYGTTTERRVHVATALRNRGTPAEEPLECYGCDAILHPRSGRDAVPLRTDEGEGFFKVRPHYAAVGRSGNHGSKRERISVHEEAVDLVASVLEASQQYSHIYRGSEARPLSLRSMERRDRQYWVNPEGPDEVDILARTIDGLNVLVQVEDRPIGSRYGNADDYIARVRRIADRDLQFSIANTEEGRIDLGPRIYQTSVVVAGDAYYRIEDGAINLSPTETVLMARFYDALHVLDLDEQCLRIPEWAVDPDTKRPAVAGETRLDTFFFAPKQFGRKTHKQVDEPVVNDPRRRVRIPKMSITEAKCFSFDPDTGQAFIEGKTGQFELL